MKFAASIITSMAQAAAEMAESARSGVILDAPSCVRSRDKFSTCAVCVDACPVDALAVESDDGATSIALDTEACVNCGLCVHLCPVGAFDGGNSVAELLAAVSRREKRHIVELVCAHHPAAEKGPPQSDLVVRSRSCLAALGPSAMMSLLALGVYHVLLRVDACRACPIGQVRAAINKSVFQAESLLVTGHGSGSPLTLLDNVREDWPARPVVRGNLPTRIAARFFPLLYGPTGIVAYRPPPDAGGAAGGG